MMRSLLLASFLALAGCSSPADSCVTDVECFAGEVCIDGFCGTPIPLIEVDMGAGDFSGHSDSGGESRDSGSGPDSSSPDMSVAPDVATTPDMTTPDMPDATAMGACYADPFDVCTDNEDPDNNSFPGVAFATMTRGCQSSGFVPLDETISGRQCALDPEDQYYITVVECDADEPGMIIEATLDVKDDCDPATIWFDVEQIGTSCANPNPDSDKTLRCETLATGQRRISVIWPGSAVPSVGSIRYSIQTPDRTDIQFDYDLRVVIREP